MKASMSVVLVPESRYGMVVKKLTIYRLAVHFRLLRRIHTGHPMRIEPDRIRLERIHTECAFAQSGSDPDRSAGFCGLAVGAAVSMQAFRGSILGAYSVFSFFFQ